MPMFGYFCGIKMPKFGYFSGTKMPRPGISGGTKDGPLFLWYLNAIQMSHKCHENGAVRPICAHVSHFGPVPGVGLFLYRG
jgi:hypothetical protein